MSAFNVIRLDTNEVVQSGIENGQLAAAAAVELTTATGVKHQPRRAAATEDWRERERARFADGTYTAVPWAGGEYWANLHPDHFVHVSTEEPGKLAFTENDEKGQADRQTRMRPGRYLQQFYSEHLGAGSREMWANKFAAQYEPLPDVQFASTPDEIEKAYTWGEADEDGQHSPTSCMSHKPDYYSSSCHPVRAYGAGDLAVAYILRDDGMTARALCWPAKKLFGRIYGDETRLVAALHKLDYVTGSLRGARMLKIDEGGGRYVLPYIDNEYAVSDCGEFFKIDPRGKYRAESTDGLSDPASRCTHCDAACDDDDMYHPEGADGGVCGSCYNDNTFYCSYTGESVWGDDYVRMANGDTWSRDAFDCHGFECEGNGNNYPNETVHRDRYSGRRPTTSNRVELADGTVWSMEYYEDHGASCEDCCETFRCEDVTYHEEDGCSYCSDCFELHKPVADEDEEEASAPVAYVSKHRARQGRDNLPGQLELPLGAYRAGDFIEVRAAPCPDGVYEVMTADNADLTMPVCIEGQYGRLWLYNTQIVRRVPAPVLEMKEAA